MDGVVRRGAGAVAGRPAGRGIEPERRLLGRPDAVELNSPVSVGARQTALVQQKFGVFHEVGLVIDDPGGADAGANLLVGRRQKDDVALQRNMRALQDEHRHELRDRLTLHIERAASPHSAVLDQTAEWIHGPVLARCKHHVHVVQQNQRARASVARQARVQIGLPRSRLENSRLDPIPPEHRGEPARGGDLVAGWVGGVDAQVLRQERGRFLAERLPVGIAGRRHERDTRGRHKFRSG